MLQRLKYCYKRYVTTSKIALQKVFYAYISVYISDTKDMLKSSLYCYKGMVKPSKYCYIWFATASIELLQKV